MVPRVFGSITIRPVKELPLDPTLRQSIDREGFELVGVTPAVSSDGVSNLIDWIDAGYAAEMDYISDRIDAYRHPSGVLDGCRSLIVMALPYSASRTHPGVGGKVARYAWSGIDYHDTIHRSLRKIRKQFQEIYPGSNVRGIVDTAPLMEREVAEAAGLGWRGKNTLLLNKSRGSYFFLSCILTDVPLQRFEPESGFAPAQVDGHCGTCTACLDACPTDAFVQPAVLDARRCISYLTIEHRGAIPVELREGIGDWIFGCDVCQEVCPWNQRRGRAEEISDPPAWSRIEPASLFELDEDEFRRQFRKTPMWRTRRRGMLRNAAIVIGNTAPANGLAAIEIGIGDHDPIIRGACIWALCRLSPPRIRKRLTMLLRSETDATVIDEIEMALASIGVT